MLLQMAGGKCSVGEIALALGISANTVNNHLKGLFGRLGVTSKAQVLAALYADSSERHAAEQIYVRPPRVLVVGRVEDEQQALEQSFERHGLSVQRVSEPWNLGFEGLRRMRLDVVVADERSLEGLLPPASAEPQGPGYVVLGGEKERAGEASERSRFSGRMTFLRRPVANDRVVFAALESSMISPYDRSRLVRASMEVPAIVDGAFWARVLNLSYGGAFVELTREHMREAQTEVAGRVLRVSFELEPRAPIAAVCSVVWQRNEPGPGLPVGYGLRFEELPSQGLERVHRLVQERRLQALRSAAESRPTRIRAAG